MILITVGIHIISYKKGRKNTKYIELNARIL